MSIVITFNSNSITLQVGPGGLQTTHKQERNQEYARAGLIEQINLYGIQEMSFDAYVSTAVYYSLFAWWSWARQGKTWAFALDSTKIGNTTLNGAAASGQKVIPLAATAAFSSGDICFIKALDADDEFEVVTIDTVQAGTSVTATSNLIYSYASADSFRHIEYWPSVKSLDEEFAPTKMNNTWSHTFKFTEAL